MRKDLNLYWWGQTASAFGSVFSAIALPIVAVVKLDASPGQLSLIGAAAMLPTLVFGLPIGTIADRVTRPRQVLLALDATSAIAIAIMAVGLMHNAVSIGWLVALALVEGCVGLFTEVVYFIHLRQLCGADQIGQQRARLQAGEYGAGFVGRLLAGPAIVLIGSAGALLIDAGSFVLSMVALLGMSRAALLPRSASARSRTSVAEMLAGAKFLLGRPFHRALTVFIVAAAVTSAAAGTLTAPFLLRTIAVPTTVYGTVFAATGMLGLAGSLAAGRVLRPGRDPRLTCLATFTIAIGCTMILPLAAGPLPLAMVCAALGLGLPIFFGAIANVALSPVIVNDVPEEETGRVTSTIRVVAGSSSLVGALLGGFLGDLLGPRGGLWSVTAGGFVALLLVLPPAVRAAWSMRQAPPAPAQTAIVPS